MNSAHLHLIFTHVPILGTLFGLALLLVALVKRSDDLKRTSLWVFVLSGLLAVPTYLTGRPASALLSKMMPGMSMDAGDQHAEVAVIALTAALVLAVAAMLGLVMGRKARSFPGWLTGLTLALALITAGSMVWTASLGGKIRHPEILDKPGAQNTR